VDSLDEAAAASSLVVEAVASAFEPCFCRLLAACLLLAREEGIAGESSVLRAALVRSLAAAAARGGLECRERTGAARCTVHCCVSCCSCKDPRYEAFQALQVFGAQQAFQEAAEVEEEERARRRCLPVAAAAVAAAAADLPAHCGFDCARKDIPARRSPEGRQDAEEEAAGTCPWSRLQIVNSC
jgi:hypothetical protein